MRKWIIGIILSITFACGFFVYMEWDNQRFADSLPKPQVVKQPVDMHPHPHPHPHEDPVPVTPSNTVVFESETGAEENTATVQMSEDGTAQVDAESQIEDVKQSGAAWQTDDGHAHQRTRSPFAQKLIDPSEMDPDELADMLLKGLLQQFGDIREVHTFMELKRKKMKNESLSLDEHIDYTAAQLHLWPHSETKKTLNIFLEKKATEYPSSTQIVR